MKKRLALLVSAMLCLSLFLVACGGGFDPPASSMGGSSASEPADSSGGTEPAGDATTLRLTHHDPPGSATGKFLDAWADMVAEKSEGKLVIEVMHGGSLAGPTESLELLKSGAVDIGWGLQAFYGGIFPMTEAMMLPMLGIETAEQGSAVFWDLYENNDYLKEEYSEYKVILLHTNCDSPISTKSKKIEAVSDISGMTLRTNSGPPTTFVKKLGATAEAVAINELYSAVERGVLDGVVTDWHAIGSFKLYEQLTYYLDAHVQVSPYWFLMNQNAYDSLDADLQKVIDDCSGAAALEICGSFWDDAQTNAMAEIDKVEGSEIYTLSDDETAKLQEIGAVVMTEWIETTGGDAQACVETIQELVTKYAGK